MSILRDDKMRPLFKEAIVTKLVVTQSTTREVFISDEFIKKTPFNYS